MVLPDTYVHGKPVSLSPDMELGSYEANALKAEKCISKTAQIASDGIKLARDVGKVSKLANKAGSVSAKIAKTVKNGVSSVARTVKKNAAKVFKNERRRNIENKNVTRGELSDYLGKSVNKELGKFYSMKNKMGGEVFVSTQRIVQSDISKIVSQTKGKLILYLEDMVMKWMM